MMRLKFVGGTSNLLPSYAAGLANWRVATLDDPSAGAPGGERAAMTATVFGKGRVFLSGAHSRSSSDFPSPYASSGGVVHPRI